MSSQYHSVDEIMKLYNDKDALYIIKDMMEKEVIRILEVEKSAGSPDRYGLVDASHAGYVSGIMWVKGELVKIEEALKNEGNKVS